MVVCQVILASKNKESWHGGGGKKDLKKEPVSSGRLSSKGGVIKKKMMCVELQKEQKGVKKEQRETKKGQFCLEIKGAYGHMEGETPRRCLRD